MLKFHHVENVCFWSSNNGGRNCYISDVIGPQIPSKMIIRGHSKSMSLTLGGGKQAKKVKN